MKQTILTILIVIILSLAAAGCITYNEANDPADPEVVYMSPTLVLTPEPTPTPIVTTVTIATVKPTAEATPEPYKVDMPISIVLDNGWTMEMYADGNGFVNTQLGEDEFGQPFVFDIQWVGYERRSGRCVFMIGEEGEYDTPIDIISDGTVILRPQSGAVRGHWF